MAKKGRHAVTTPAKGDGIQMVGRNATITPSGNEIAALSTIVVNLHRANPVPQSATSRLDPIPMDIPETNDAIHDRGVESSSNIPKFSIKSGSILEDIDDVSASAAPSSADASGENGTQAKKAARVPSEQRLAPSHMASLLT